MRSFRRRPQRVEVLRRAPSLVPETEGSEEPSVTVRWDPDGPHPARGGAEQSTARTSRRR